MTKLRHHLSGLRIERKLENKLREGATARDDQDPRDDDEKGYMLANFGGKLGVS